MCQEMHGGFNNILIFTYVQVQGHCVYLDFTGD